MDRNADVGHPGQAGVAQVVAAQMLVAQVGDDLVPVGCVAKHGRGDSTAARPGEDPRRWVIVNSMEALFDQWTDLFNERDGAGPLAFSAFVDDPPGLGVVCRRTVQVQASRSMSAHRMPDTSPIRAAVQAVKITTLPQPSK